MTLYAFASPDDGNGLPPLAVTVEVLSASIVALFCALMVRLPPADSVPSVTVAATVLRTSLSTKIAPAACG